MSWFQMQTINSRSFTCGHCSEQVATNQGFLQVQGNDAQGKIYICHHCKKPTFFDDANNQTPGAKYGSQVQELTEDIERLYTEARDSYGVNAYTSTVMCCRKILMHVAVSEGAGKNKSFKYYVEYLSDNNVVPNKTKDWIDEIRGMGNDANHEIKVNTKEEAKEIISFTEMLLKLVFEYPNRIKSKSSDKDKEADKDVKDEQP